MSSRGHLTKFLMSFDNLFLHLFDNFLMASHCIWPIKMIVVGKPTCCLTSLSPPVLTFLSASLNVNHQKDVTKLSKTNKKLCQVCGYGWMFRTVNTCTCLSVNTVRYICLPVCLEHIIYRSWCCTYFTDSSLINRIF